MTLMHKEPLRMEEFPVNTGHTHILALLSLFTPFLNVMPSLFPECFKNFVFTVPYQHKPLLLNTQI